VMKKRALKPKRRDDRREERRAPRKKPSGPRPLREDLVTQACLEAYGAVRHENRLADRALEFVLRNRSNLYSHERRAVAERVYALLRRQRLVDFLAERAFPRFASANTTRKDLLRLAASRVLEGEPAGAVGDALTLVSDEAVALARVPALRSELSSLPPGERFAVEASLPDFLAARLRAELGPEAVEAAAAMNQRAPLTVRANALKITRDELAQRLRRDGVEVKTTPLSPFGLHLETRVNVYSLEAFKEGLFEVQDEGSQLLGMLVDGPPRTVVDACAGAGGKTLQIAAQMKNRGDLYALDVDERRLGELKLRARRAGVHNVRVKPIPGEGPEAETALLPLKDAAERVLVDAPCTGTGTFRRKPDARYRLDEASLADHVQRQKQLLARFATMVKPGGRLVYGTCSLLREENEEVVKDFLFRHPHFEVLPAAQWLGPELGQKCTVDGALRLYPHRHNTDGFYGVVLGRKKQASSPAS